MNSAQRRKRRRYIKRMAVCGKTFRFTYHNRKAYFIYLANYREETESFQVSKWGYENGERIGWLCERSAFTVDTMIRKGYWLPETRKGI